MKKTTSYDGTPIAYSRHGSGSPLILVAGTGAANPIAWPAFPALEAHFSVYTFDRRGRGESGDGPAYAIEREGEDIAAVIDAIGEPVDLLAHSYGGICALEAAWLTPNLRKLVLYEGVPIPGAPMVPQGVADRLQTLLDVGDKEGALTLHYRENAGLQPAEIEQMRSSPAWPERVATVHTIPRELRAEEAYQFDPERFRALETPVLLLLGGDSPQFVIDATETVAAALPHSRIAVLPGQQHIAMYTAPSLFVDEVVEFLEEPG